MNALLVCTAVQPGGSRLIAHEAGSHDLVVAVDGGADACLEAGVRPDLVVGDLDSVASGTRTLLERLGVEIEAHPTEKDATDLALALETARERGATEITVTGAFSGRLDHTLAAIGALARASDLSPRLVEPGQVGWVLSASSRSSVEIDGSGTVFSVVALGGVARVTVEGARWPLEDVELAPLSDLGVSNRVVGEVARVEVSNGTALVMRVDG